MLKRFVYIFFLGLLAESVMAQHASMDARIDTTFVVGIYENVTYHAVRNHQGLWDVVSENRLHYAMPRFERLYTQKTIFANTAAFAVRKGGYCGITDIMGREILPFVYRSVKPISTQAFEAIDIHGRSHVIHTQDILDKQKQSDAAATRKASDAPAPRHTQYASLDSISVRINSPKNNGEYSATPLALRYLTNIKKYDANGTITFYVNGEEVPETEITSKGVRPASKEGTEVLLPVPRDPEKKCNISVKVTTQNGLEKSDGISLFYVGESVKPTLHLFAVGISHYDSEDMMDLSFAAKDAQDFVDAIKQSGMVDMYDQLKCQHIPQEEATQERIKDELIELRNDVAQGDVVILYFSGHGIKDGEDAYFMSKDAPANKPHKGVEFDFIRKQCRFMANDRKCKVIIFLDACHSGTMFGMKGDNDLRAIEPSITGFYSSTQSETSAETKKAENGVFTRALIDGIKGKAMKEDGTITITSLWEYINEYVKKETNKSQHPLIENIVGDAVILKK